MRRHQCSRCLRRFQHHKKAQAHIQSYHHGKGSVLEYRPQITDDDSDDSFADRAIKAELSLAMGEYTDDDWLIP